MEITIKLTINENEVKNVKVEMPDNIGVIEMDTKSVIQNVSQYARFFDDSCTGWMKDAEYSLLFLKNQQDYCTDKLKTQGHLFLNEVYDSLGIPRTKAGQIIGWIYDEESPIGDNCVDFGLYLDRNKDFVNGYKTTALLDFNVDGNILDLI